MEICRIELLGELRVTHGSRVATRFRTRKAASLLAYLALFSDRGHTRERLIDAFWPDMDLETGRSNLSTTLSSIRRLLESLELPAKSLVIADHMSIRLNGEMVVTDTAEFARKLHAAMHTDNLEMRAALLGEAIGLYRGEVLAGHYEEWAVQAQSYWRERYVEALERRGETLEAIGDREAALDAFRQAVHLDRYREEHYRTQIRLLAALGRPAAALELFGRVEAMFQAELGVLPAPETRDLAERVRRDPHAFTRRLTASQPVEPSGLSAAAAGRNAENAKVRASGADASRVPPGLEPASEAEPESSRLHPPAGPSLPPQWTRFFGREAELALLQNLLAPRDDVPAGSLSAPGCDSTLSRRPRLISLTGLGGTGKTRLAVEAAYAAADLFDGRIWFVPLAEVSNPRLIPLALAGSLDLSPTPTADPLEQVVEALGDRPGLLLLDNFEHLLRKEDGARKGEGFSVSGADYVRLLLERVPDLVCLVTSRRPLRLGSEYEAPVPPFAPPAESDSLESIGSSACVALFTDRAQAARRGFALTEHNAAAVAALCRLLDGMPLAIEMAAAWMNLLTPGQALVKLGNRLDLLVSRRRDVPARQQSMRATIAWSDSLLEPDARVCFARLSVFRGGWTLKAAEALCGDGALGCLSDLQDHSLIHADASGEEARYRMLEAVREYALERLSQSGEERIVRCAHADCFLALAEEASGKLVGAEQRVWLNRLAQEHDNLRAALEFYHRYREDDPEALWRLAAALRRFWEIRGHENERRLWLEGTAASGSPLRTAAKAMVLGGAGNLARDLGDYARARRRFEESLAVMRELGNRWGVAEALNDLGLVAGNLKDAEAARALHLESLELMRAEGDKRGVSHNLFNLGTLAYERGDLAEARRFWEECRAVDRELGVAGGYVLKAMSDLACVQGDFEAANRYLKTLFIERRSLDWEGNLSARLREFAEVALRSGDAVRAARLWGAASAAAKPPVAGIPNESFPDGLRDLLGANAVAEALAEGAALTPEQAMAYAFGDAPDDSA